MKMCLCVQRILWTAEISTTEYITKELGKPNIMVMWQFVLLWAACCLFQVVVLFLMKVVATLTDSHIYVFSISLSCWH